jgi:hypothetical protein
VRWTWGDFITLSYVWGESTSTRQVEINGAKHPVTENLYHLLKEIYTGTGLGARLSRFSRNHIWVDAICINQKDLHERNLQVQRMATIYSQACISLCWLGDGVHDHAISQGLLVAAAAASQDTDRLKAIAKTDEILFTSVYQLYNAPYWTRMWIIQETILPIATTYICLDQYIAGNTLLLGTIKLLAKLKKLFCTKAVPACEKVGVQARAEKLHAQMTQVSFILSLMYRKGHGKPDLCSLMQLAHNSRQKDDRDKIYGLLGLFDQGLQAAIRPDYTQSTARVYTGFARAVINHQRSLDFICRFQTSGDGISGPPSWVPDWTKRAESVHLVRSNSSAENTRRIVDMHSLAETTFSTEEVLSTKGFIFDLCDGLGTAVKNAFAPRMDGLGLVHTSATHCNVYGTCAEIRKALVQTMVAGKNSGKDKKSVISEELLKIPHDREASSVSNLRRRKDFLIYSKLRVLNGLLRLGGRLLANYYVCPLEAGQHLQEDVVIDALSAAERYSLGRRLVITQKGYLGLAPEMSQKGDVICILFGSNVPVILRPVNGAGSGQNTHWAWVGECYVHGIMDGEAMKMVTEDPSIVRTFHIC